MKIAELKELFPDVFDGVLVLPERFEIPEKLVYMYIIHTLAKYYSLYPAVCCGLKEIDFWQMRAFEGLEEEKNEYLLKLRNEQ